MADNLESMPGVAGDLEAAGGLADRRQMIEAGLRCCMVVRDTIGTERGARIEGRRRGFSGKRGGSEDGW
jgi:hypothetical protein